MAYSQRSLLYEASVCGIEAEAATVLYVAGVCGTQKCCIEEGGARVGHIIE